MKCMKCGTAISSDQVFCESCRDEMERYPVKPGTPIQLPNRPEKVQKNTHKKVRKPEEIIANLQAFIFWLILLIVALGVALGICIHMLLTLAGPILS